MKSKTDIRYTTSLQEIMDKEIYCVNPLYRTTWRRGVDGVIYYFKGTFVNYPTDEIQLEEGI